MMSINTTSIMRAKRFDQHYLPLGRIEVRPADSIVERQAEGLVDVLTALSVEQVLLKVVPEGEEGAALRTRSGLGR